MKSGANQFEATGTFGHRHGRKLATALVRRIDLNVTFLVTSGFPLTMTSPLHIRHRLIFYPKPA